MMKQESVVVFGAEGEGRGLDPHWTSQSKADIHILQTSVDWVKPPRWLDPPLLKSE